LTGWRAEDVEPISAVQPDNGSKSKAEAKQDAPIYESPEKRELFEKTLAAIRQIMGGLEEISSRRLTDELTRIEGGPWSEWGDGRCRKPLGTWLRAARLPNCAPADRTGSTG
jgi:hypothetical protein